MRARKFSALFICMMISFINFSPIEGNIAMNISDIAHKNGVPGRIVTSIDGLRDCTDPALVKMKCDEWLPNAPSDGDYGGITVFLDDGLSVTDWQNLESGFYGMSIDIIGYLTPDDQGNIPDTLIGGFGQDSLQGITDADLGYLDSDFHALGVLSAFGTIARNAKVLFVNIREKTDLPENTGFLLYDSRMWEWIKNNIGQYNIRIISTSINTGYLLAKNQTNTDLLTEIYEQGVFMVAAIGNDAWNDPNRGHYFPNYHPYVYSIGSIDHETRGNSDDEDYYSVENRYSGFSQACRDGENNFTLCASYGDEWDVNPAEALDFVMPGNGVPIAFEPTIQQVLLGHVLEFASGTSYSAPYLAATALVAIYGYSQAYYSVAGSFAYPSVSMIYDFLKENAYSP
ncbi:MAG: hypothetical protein D6732_20615, partial [Methanobacteriota archaeon]